MTAFFQGKHRVVKHDNCPPLKEPRETCACRKEGICVWCPARKLMKRFQLQWHGGWERKAATK